MSKTQELPLHEVHLSSARGKDVIVTLVPEHEIAVLRVIHGANVNVIGETDEADDFPAAAADEAARLQRKYRRANDQDPVRIAYPGMASDLARAGFDAGAKETKAPRSSNKSRPRKKAAKKAAGK